MEVTKNRALTENEVLVATRNNMGLVVNIPAQTYSFRDVETGAVCKIKGEHPGIVPILEMKDRLSLLYELVMRHEKWEVTRRKMYREEYRAAIEMPKAKWLKEKIHGDAFRTAKKASDLPHESGGKVAPAPTHPKKGFAIRTEDYTMASLDADVFLKMAGAESAIEDFKCQNISAHHARCARKKLDVLNGALRDYKTITQGRDWGRCKRCNCWEILNIEIEKYNEHKKGYEFVTYDNLCVGCVWIPDLAATGIKMKFMDAEKECDGWES